MKEHVIINRDRTVVVPESLKKIGIQFDHNVNTITFDCPRYPDEDPSIDMSQMPIFINYMLPDKTPGSSLALNVVVDETDDTLMHFDWKITNAITPVNGVLSTLICVKQSDTEGNELYHWNTDLFQKFTVGNGMECNGQVAEMNPDVISQLLARMGEVDTRTSAEAMSGYINEYMTENPPQPTDEQASAGINTYMASNGQTHVNGYITENQELVQNSVDDYLGRNPLQLDKTLTDSTKAAPADLVGELKGDLANIVEIIEVTELNQNSDRWTYMPSKYCAYDGYKDTDVYDSVQMLLGTETSLYMKQYGGSNITIIAFPSGVVPTSWDNDAIRYRSVDNNLPTETNKATIPNGSMLVITYPKNSTFTLGGDFGDDGYKLKEKIVGFENLTDEVNEKLNEIVPIFKETILSVGNGKQYSRIKDAIDACINPSFYNRYIIEFYGNGTEYDLLEETNEWNTEHSSTIGMMIPDYTTLRGIGGKDKCKFALRLESPSTTISPLNIKGTSNLEGITVIGNNTRYTIHDDYETVGNEIYKERHISNCDFIGESLSYGTTWGAGFRSGNIWYFENCRFISKNSDGSPFTCHNNKRFTEPARLYFKNCRSVIPSNVKGFGFGTISDEANDIINEIYFYGCKTNRISFYEQAPETYGEGMLFKLSGYGNDLNNSDVEQTTPDTPIAGNKIVISRSDGADYSSQIDMI